MTDTTTTKDTTHAPEDNDAVSRTRYTEYTDSTTHNVKTVTGHDVNVDDRTETDTHLIGEFDDRVKQLVWDAENQRQAIEDERANHRNFNRMMTLLGALLIGLVVTFVLTHGWLGPAGKTLAPYAFVITILLDSSLAAYSYIRHY